MPLYHIFAHLVLTLFTCLNKMHIHGVWLTSTVLPMLPVLYSVAADYVINYNLINKL